MLASLGHANGIRGILLKGLGLHLICRFRLYRFAAGAKQQGSEHEMERQDRWHIGMLTSAYGCGKARNLQAMIP